MKNDDFEARLQRHLMKAELDFRAKEPRHTTVQWLNPRCDTAAGAAEFLRSLGYRISRIVDEDSKADPDGYHWVETTNGLIVYVRSEEDKRNCAPVMVGPAPR